MGTVPTTAHSHTHTHTEPDATQEYHRNTLGDTKSNREIDGYMI